MPKRLSNVNDIVGKKFGKLTVIKYLDYHDKNHRYICSCDCGTTNIITNRSLLLKGDKISCGCAYKDAGKARKENLIGQRFGRWTVIDEAPTRYSKSGKTRSIMWKCKCDCGTIKNVGARALKKGTSLSCGCFQKENISKIVTDDLVGKKFGYLTVIERDGTYVNGNAKNALWKCKCECGNFITTLGFSLKNGDTTSCGCKKISKYELYVEEYLIQCGYTLNQNYFKEKTFDNLTGLGGGLLRFDFFVKLKSGENVLIECQGKQHFEPVKYYGGMEYFNKLQIHDMLKKNFAKNNNYRLIEIDYKAVLYEDIEKVLKNNFVY